MPRARWRRTVLRSSPTLRAMAETDSPCRFKSWIKTISPSVTTCSPPPFDGNTVGLEAAISIRGHACPRMLSFVALTAGEFSFGTSGENTIGTHMRRGIDELEQQMPEVKAEVERESRAVCCATQISQALWRLDQNYPLLPNQERRRSVVSPETLWRS